MRNTFGRKILETWIHMCPHEVLIISSLSFWATEQRAQKLNMFTLRQPKWTSSDYRGYTIFKDTPHDPRRIHLNHNRLDTNGFLPGKKPICRVTSSLPLMILNVLTPWKTTPRSTKRQWISWFLVKLQKNITGGDGSSVWTCWFRSRWWSNLTIFSGLIAEAAGFLLRDSLNQHQDPPAGIEVRDGLYYNV